MAISEEEQMAAMLAEMGLDSIDQLDVNPIPEAPVRKKIQSSKSEVSDDEVSITEVNAVSTENSKAESQNSETPSSAKHDSSNIFQRSGLNRELTISSLVHLMGLPTATQMNVLDTKLDLLTSKLGIIQSKLERIQSHLDLVSANSPIERIEFQLNEVRTIMKKFFPQAFVGVSSQSTLETTKLAQPQVLTNKSKTSQAPNSESRNETKIITAVEPSQKQDSLELSEDEPLTDADYQAIEAMKMREKNDHDKK